MHVSQEPVAFWVDTVAEVLLSQPLPYEPSPDPSAVLIRL